VLYAERLIRQRLSLARPEALVVVHGEIEQDVLVNQRRAERRRLNRPEYRHDLAARVTHWQTPPGS
jgi:hypothetical protein